MLVRMALDQVLIYGFPAIAIIIAVVKVARELGFDSKYVPVLSLVLGILCGIVISFEQGLTIPAGIVLGVVLGTAACGTYDVGKYTNKV